MRTLLVRLDHLGDLLLTTPLLRALARADHEVDLLARQAFLPVLAHSPYVQTAFSIEDVAPNFPRRWWRLARWMRSRHYDLIILAYAKEKRLCFASAFSGASQRIAMWGGLWGRLTLHRCLRSEILTNPRPFSKILLLCAEAVGAPEQGLKPDLFLSEEERGAANSLFPASLAERRLIGIHPGSAGNACNLPSKVYGELAARILRETDYGLVLTGTAAEKPLLNDWPSEVLDSKRTFNSVGRLSLRQLASVIAELKVYVCPSTGPLHIASAMGVQTVSPFCPAVPLNAAIWGNVGAPSRVVQPRRCPRLAGSDRSCHFEGEITASELLAEVVALANSANDAQVSVDHRGHE